MFFNNFLILAILLLSSTAVNATLCKELANENNEVVVIVPGKSGSEIKFQLWPNRLGIAFISNQSSGVVKVYLKSSLEDETQRHKVEGFHLFANNYIDYLECVNMAIEGSRQGKSLRVQISDSWVGYYDHDPVCDGTRWGSFMGHDVFQRLVCEIID